MFNNRDLQRYGYSGFPGFVKGYFVPGFRYMLFFRGYNKSSKVIKPFFKVVLRFLSRWYGIQIEVNTKIDSGFYIGHFGTIVINGNVVIGKNCNISQGVTIGATNRGSKKGAPILGNEVWVGTNSVIVGKINIGDNVLIAPNSFVNFDVPSNSIVFGNPAIIKENIKATEGYISNKI